MPLAASGTCQQSSGSLVCVCIPPVSASVICVYLYFPIFKKLFICWASLVAQMVKNLPPMRETWVRSLGLEDPWKRAWQPPPVFFGCPGPELRHEGPLIFLVTCGMFSCSMEGI